MNGIEYITHNLYHYLWRWTLYLHPLFDGRENLLEVLALRNGMMGRVGNRLI